MFVASSACDNLVTERVDYCSTPRTSSPGLPVVPVGLYCSSPLDEKTWREFLKVSLGFLRIIFILVTARFTAHNIIIIVIIAVLMR